MIEMTIHSIRVNMMNYQRVVMLKEKMTERYLPIWIGAAEADAISVKLQDIKVPRPLTHDLLQNVISTLGARINSIIVSELKNETFYAKIIFDVDGGHLEIDSRPSDALALAVRADVPIYAEETVLDKASILLDKDATRPAISGGEEGEIGDRKVSEDELKGMSAFQDFINTLDLEDFNKRKS